MKSPSHLKGLIEDLCPFASLIRDRDNNTFLGYRVKCSGGGHQFSVAKNVRPFVVAKCIKCASNITIYDVSRYPDATPFSDEGPIRQVLGPNGEASYKLCVAFEYPESDEDEEHGENDVS